MHPPAPSLTLLLALLCCLPASGQAPVTPPTRNSDGGMVPFTLDHRAAFAAPSPVDVSFLLDAPAGKHGFVQARDGHLATADGRRLRLWGVNITDWSKGSRQIPSKEDAPLWASTLARFGVNCVRLQFLDLPTPRGLVDSRRKDTRALDPEALDREDFLLAELEKRGIYLDINLLVGRPFKAADEVADAAQLGEGAKATSMFDKRMIELQKEYARQLLGHRNTYTGHTYAEDPAVAIVEINNENSIQVGYHMPSAFYSNELQLIYSRWLASHTTASQLALLHQQARTDPLAPLPLMQSYNDFENRPNTRFYAEANFYTDLQQAYFADMESYLKQTLGVKSLLIGTADHHHTASGYPTVLANSRLDLLDGHTYWQHPEVRAPKRPMVNDPYHSTVVDLSRSALAGKPYTVSEVNHPFPNDYGSEGIPILAAYASLQDWDGVFWYTFEPKTDPQWRPYVGDPFDLSLDPVKMPELAAGALLFLRGDVLPARQTAARSYSQKQVFDSMLLPSSDRPLFTPGLSPATPLEHEVRIASLHATAGTAPPPAPTQPSPIRSDTGELAWYFSAAPTGGLVTLDAPRSAALIGFVGGNTTRLTHLSASVTNPFCTLLLTSLDAQPIAQSSRL
ncbi:MAG TPA: hypothetical protein VGD62_02770, partial [Acidobacteriaceae bacterium]